MNRKGKYIGQCPECDLMIIDKDKNPKGGANCPRCLTHSPLPDIKRLARKENCGPRMKRIFAKALKKGMVTTNFGYLFRINKIERSKSPRGDSIKWYGKLTRHQQNDPIRNKVEADNDTCSSVYADARVPVLS